MKYLITESQIGKSIFKYLNKQNFIQVEKNNNTYFLNSKGDKYAQIIYKPESRFILINYELIKELREFFSLDSYDESKKFVKSWIELGIGLGDVEEVIRHHPDSSALLIP
jgi:hypothetical protein